MGRPTVHAKGPMTAAERQKRHRAAKTRQPQRANAKAELVPNPAIDAFQALLAEAKRQIAEVDALLKDREK
jgi:hypothetical protein